MKQIVAMLSFCVCLGAGVQARCAKLPDACGDDQVKFDVTTQEGQTAPAPPSASKAQIVFIEDGGGRRDTVRFGVDGAWVGATTGNSYFTLEVAPGIHHLCASWLGGTREFDLAPVTAEVGKVYFFAAEVTRSQYYWHFDLSQLNDDQGKYRVKTWKLSTSKPKPEDQN
jgi:hypothetical protein